MTAWEPDATFAELELPAEFEDLEGLLRADLLAIVAMLTERAHDRLFLTHQEHRRLQARLWNHFAGVIRDSLEPLQIQYRG